MSEELKEKTYWENKIKEHWKPFLVVIIACICLFIGALLVLIWYILTSPIGGQGKWTFDLWTLNYVVGFMIQIILWELLFVGIPAVVFFGVGGYIWWSRLSAEEKAEYKAREKTKKHRKRNAGGEGGGGLFMFIAYCIYMGVIGKYNTEFGAEDYSYWIFSWFYTLMWILIIFGIPIAIILVIVYFTVWRKKSE
jgi:hypothetical protein